MMRKLVMVLALAGCVVAREPVRVAQIGALEIGAPAGYCVDPSGSDYDASGGFVLFGACNALFPKAYTAPPALPVALTATVMGAAPEGFSGELDALEGFFRSEAGRAALSRAGDAATVEILAFRQDRDSLWLHVADSAEGAGDLSARYWRGVSAVNGQMVALAALVRQGAALEDGDLLDLLRAFRERVRASAKKP